MGSIGMSKATLFLSTFIIEETAKYQLEISETEDKFFSYLCSQTPIKNLIYYMLIITSTLW